MSRLPKNPNLEHLKQQAKDLLRAARNDEQTARLRLAALAPKLDTAQLKLADAQWVIAREYGFPSWLKLKTFVEGQAPHTRQPVKARQFFVEGLAHQLETQANDAEALGTRFALMPLRDILAVRTQLGRNGTLRNVTGGLLQGLLSAQARVRFDCANALDHFADERCTIPLRDLLSDPVPRVRRAALHSLSCDACKLSPLTPCADLARILIEMVRHEPSIRVRRTVVPLLEQYFADEYIQQLLTQLATGQDREMARDARHILRRQASQLVTSP